MNFRYFKKIYFSIDHFLFKRRNLFVYNKKIKKLIGKKVKLENKLTSEQKKEIRKYFNTNGFKDVKTDWHLFFSSANGLYDKKYIPEDIFYTEIEPALNADIMFPALEDKNLLEMVFPMAKQPKTIVKNLFGSYYNLGQRINIESAITICSEHQSFFIKPSMVSDGGKDVDLNTRGKDSQSVYKERIGKLFKSYGSNFIVQQVLEQNEALASLNPTSINTIRTLSYLREDGVVLLSEVLRIGGLGSVVDNGNFGGTSCGIHEDGTLKKFAFDKKGIAFAASPVGKELEGFKIPNFKEVQQVVKTCHEQIPYFKIVSWDFAIDKENNIILIEFNSRGQGINRQQLNNGPLFGAYTEEILAITKKHDPIADKMKFGK